MFLGGILSNRLINVEHIGSTSVPGMAGKPTIDILAVVETIEDVESFQEKLELAGYKFLGQYVMDDSRLFVKEENDTRLVNLHFYPKGHFHIDEMLGLRDYLRTHSEIVKEYSDLKFELLEKYPGDYGAYRKYKDEWMNNLKRRVGVSV